MRHFEISHLVCIFMFHVYAPVVMQMQHKHFIFILGNLFEKSNTCFFSQWRCFWHMSEPSQSLWSGHSAQLLGLSLGVLGGSHHWRPDCSSTGSVGATQHTLYTMIPVFVFWLKIQYWLNRLQTMYPVFADCYLATGRFDSFWNET